MKTRIALSILFLVLTGHARAADIPWPESDPFVHQPPTQAGGPPSDTLFQISPGLPFWQQAAENILLSESSTARRVSWWGFYNDDNPPPNETLRLRFFDARPSDGLPGNILFEESFLNPARMATGEIVGTFNLPHEYFYSAELSTPIGLEAGITYWLEISQIGDIGTMFRWEFAPSSGTPYAFMNPNVSDWTQSTLVSDLAFQLWSIPEPYAALLLVIGCLGIRRRRRARRRSLSPSLG